MQEWIKIILSSFTIGAAAYVYAVTLQMPGEILAFLPGVANYLPTWAAKPLITCQKCVAGQLAFWTYPLVFDYHLLFHILTVTTSIFFAVLITSWLGDAPRRAPKWTPPEANNSTE